MLKIENFLEFVENKELFTKNRVLENIDLFDFSYKNKQGIGILDLIINNNLNFDLGYCFSDFIKILEEKNKDFLDTEKTNFSQIILSKKCLTEKLKKEEILYLFDNFDINYQDNQKKTSIMYFLEHYDFYQKLISYKDIVNLYDIDYDIVDNKKESVYFYFLNTIKSDKQVDLNIFVDLLKKLNFNIKNNFHNDSLILLFKMIKDSENKNKKQLIEKIFLILNKKIPNNQFIHVSYLFLSDFYIKKNDFNKEKIYIKYFKNKDFISQKKLKDQKQRISHNKYSILVYKKNAIKQLEKNKKISDAEFIEKLIKTKDQDIISAIKKNITKITWRYDELNDFLKKNNAVLNEVQLKKMFFS